MIDAFQPTPNVPTQVALTTFRRNKQRLSPVSWPEVWEYFDLTKPSDENLGVRELCNQIIHSHFFSLWLGPDRALRGIFFCSDRYKDRKVYRIDISVIVELFERIASSDRRTASLVHFYPDHNRCTM
jgi:hypothetical protein